MAKKALAPLIMGDGARVRSIEELREYFDLATVLKYHANGKLEEWLLGHYYDEEAEKIKSLDVSQEGFKQQLCEILKVPYLASTRKNDSVDISMFSDNISAISYSKIDYDEIVSRNERLEKLKKYTADDEILGAIDSVVFTQEELIEFLDKGKKTIYLCGESFVIPNSADNAKLIGVNFPKISVTDGFKKNAIVFENLNLGLPFIVHQAEISTDSAEAFQLWRNAAELGDLYAQYMLGKCYEIGNGVEKNLLTALELYRCAAEQGLVMAQEYLGRCYYSGHGVAQSYSEAVFWFRKAALQDFDLAQRELAICYYAGLGVEQDYTQAVEWYRKAAEQGDVYSQYSLAKCYFDEKVERDSDEIYKWYKSAAEQGHADAQYELARWCYDWGCGTEINREEAFKWFMKAAEQGNAEAQCEVGERYYDGNGIEKDCEKAMEWLMKSVKQGNSQACYFVGNYYYDKGNYQEAYEYYSKSGTAGAMGARVNMVVSGLVPGKQKDFDDIKIYADNGDKKCKLYLEKKQGLSSRTFNKSIWRL